MARGNGNLAIRTTGIGDNIMQIPSSIHTADTNPVTAPSSSSTAAATAATDPTANLANEDTFLQLLVAQIQNQDPTNPTDSIQFVTQLAQFSQLEQLIGIHNDLDNLSPGSAG